MIRPGTGNPRSWLLLSCLGALAVMGVLALVPGSLRGVAVADDVFDEKDDDFDDFDKDEVVLTRMVGLVKSVGEGLLELKVKEGGKGTWKVTHAKDVSVHRYVTLPFDELSDGIPLEVLGQRVKARPGSGGGKYPPEILKIRAIVAGTGYEPPAVPPEVKKLNVRWHGGKLKKREKPVEFRLNSALIQYGRQRDVVQRKAATWSDIAKKDLLLIRGTLKGDKKAKTIEVSEVHIFDFKMWKSKSYRIILPSS